LYQDETLGSKDLRERKTTVTNLGRSASLNAVGGPRGVKRIITGLLCVLSAASSYAACPATTPVPQEIKDSDAVVIGTVQSARMVPQTWDTLDGTEYTVQIDQKVKGKASGEIKILSERAEDSVPLVAGTRYLLFLTNNNQHWMINKCGNTSATDEESPAVRQVIHPSKND
jgi:hypothetical protein